jgi:hypothetical protein
MSLVVTAGPAVAIDWQYGFHPFIADLFLGSTVVPSPAYFTICTVEVAPAAITGQGRSASSRIITKDRMAALSIWLD